METLRYETIDGIKVVCDIDTLPVDPVRTKRRVKELVDKSQERKDYDKAVASGDVGSTYNALVQATNRLRTENVVYAEGMRGCERPENTPELAARYRSLGKRQRMTVTGKILEDNRGRQYMADDYSVGTVRKLGETLPDGATWAEDATPVQREQAQKVAEQRRIAALSAEARMVEMQNELAVAAQRAAQQRSVYEIQGRSAEDALKDSQSLYRMLESEIRGRYES
jgi:hypothetical protein